MQLNPIEMRVLQGAATIPQLPFRAFQLPTISPAVPSFVEVVDRQVDFTPFTQALLDAGVIQPEMIGPSASTPKCILEQGLRAWFKERTDRLKHLKFDARVSDPVAAAALHQCYDEEIPEYKNWVFALTGYETTEVRVAEPIALELEAKCPGLFYSAFSEMEQGGWRTVDILTPMQVIDQTAAFMLWDGDLSEMPSDEDAMEYLVDRYGEDADKYLPSILMKVWGQGYCFPRKGQRSLGARKLKKLCKSPDHQVATIASQLLKLREAKRYADECGARFCGVNMHPLFTGCSIGFNRDDRYTEYIDTYVNGIYESGEYSECITIEEFPSNPDDLDSYFIKLDALFQLMAEVDALIPLLSRGDDTD
jgi:PRTRC genetic system protein F